MGQQKETEESLFASSDQQPNLSEKKKKWGQDEIMSLISFKNIHLLKPMDIITTYTELNDLE